MHAHIDRMILKLKKKNGNSFTQFHLLVLCTNRIYFIFENAQFFRKEINYGLHKSIEKCILYYTTIISINQCEIEMLFVEINEYPNNIRVDIAVCKR